MRFGERFARLEQVLGGLFQRQRPSLLEDRAQIRAAQILHDDVRRAAFERADVDHAHAVLALDLHRRARLALEARDHVAAGKRLRQEELDRDRLVELKMLRQNHDSGAALTENPIHSELAPDHCSWLNRSGHLLSLSRNLAGLSSSRSRRVSRGAVGATSWARFPLSAASGRACPGTRIRDPSLTEYLLGLSFAQWKPQRTGLAPTWTCTHPTR